LTDQNEALNIAAA